MLVSSHLVSRPFTVQSTSLHSFFLVQGANNDFVPLTTSLVFSSATATSGTTTLQECIMFNIVSDSVPENTESFTVTVTLTSADADSPVSSASGTVTITDVDGKKAHVHAAVTPKHVSASMLARGICQHIATA